MQILKGITQKSVTVQHLLSSTNSFCCVYDKEALPFGDLFVNSEVCNLKELKKMLKENVPQKKYDYLIIYTNISEGELLSFLGWLNCKFDCAEILVTCKF